VVFTQELRKEDPLASHGFLAMDVETSYHMLLMVEGAISGCDS